MSPTSTISALSFFASALVPARSRLTLLIACFSASHLYPPKNKIRIYSALPEPRQHSYVQSAL